MLFFYHLFFLFEQQEAQKWQLIHPVPPRLFGSGDASFHAKLKCYFLLLYSCSSAIKVVCLSAFIISDFSSLRWRERCLGVEAFFRFFLSSPSAANPRFSAFEQRVYVWPLETPETWAFSFEVKVAVQNKQTDWFLASGQCDQFFSMDRTAVEGWVEPRRVLRQSQKGSSGREVISCSSVCKVHQ